MRHIAKQLIQVVSVVISLPLIIVDYALRSLGAGDGIFAAIVQLLSLVPGKTGSYLRLGFLRFSLPACHPDAFIGFGTLLSQRKTELGRGIYIGPQCNIGSCRIGDDTLIASGVHIMSGTEQHRFDDLDTPIRDQSGVYASVTIGADCWIGNGALVMADVGDHSIVGAGSVVTRPIPPYSIAAGNPARVIRQRDGCESSRPVNN